MTYPSAAVLPTDDNGTNTTGTPFAHFWAEEFQTDIGELIHSGFNPTLTPADIIDEVVLARRSKATLLAFLSVSLDASGNLISTGDLATTRTEVINGRGAYGSLDARFDADEAVQTAQAAILTSAGLVTGGGPVPVRAAVDFTSRPNGTTVETDLHSFTLAAAALDVDGDSLMYEAKGTFANTANQKTLKFKFGLAGVVTLQSAVTTANVGWYLRVRVVRTAAATQTIYTELVVGTTVIAVAPVATTEILANALTVKLTGQSNTASNDVVQTFGRAVVE